MKNIIKEVIIMGLTLIVLILVFGILFYDYVPIGKFIPDNVNYKMPEEIAKELEEFSSEETAPLNIVYEVSARDLTGYEKGKVNPYAFASSANENIEGNETSTTTGDTTTTTTTNTTVPKGNFFDNGTTK